MALIAACLMIQVTCSLGSTVISSGYSLDGLYIVSTIVIGSKKNGK